jgi:hypothetical protein
MSYEVSGKLKVIEPKQTFASGFEKQEFVITTEEQYPQHIKLELVKEKISLLQGMNVGDTVTASFNLRGSEYNGKYYVNLQAWKLQKGVATPTAPASSASTASAPKAPWPDAAAPIPAAGDDDDLPF